MRLAADRFEFGLMLRNDAAEGPTGPASVIFPITEETVKDFQTRLSKLAGGTDASRSRLLEDLLRRSRMVWPLSRPPSEAPHVILPDNDVWKFWQDYEALPFEAALGANGPSVGSAGVVVRATGAHPKPPIVVGEDKLRILIVTASPRSKRLSIAESEAKSMIALQAGRRELVDVRVLQGADTVSQLTRLNNKVWDIVHIVAHGSRENGAVCLCTRQDSEKWEGFKDFAELIAGHLRGTRLFTLAMCDSSPLAVELAKRFESAQVVALLAETSENGVSQFFRSFFDVLLRWTAPGRSFEPGISVVDAVGHSVRGLYDEKNPEWILPIVYGPAHSEILLDLRSIKDQIDKIEAIEALARSGHLREAREEAEGQKFNRAKKYLSEWASNFVNECDIVLRSQNRLEELTTDLQTAAKESPVWLRFQDIHDHWKQVNLAAVPMVGAAQAIDDNPRPVLEILEDMQAAYEGLHKQALLAAEALAGLGKAIPDWIGTLKTGSGLLRDFLQARHGDLSASSAVIRSAAGERIKTAGDSLATSDRDNLRREAISNARGTIADMAALRRSTNDLLQPSEADNIRDDCDRLLQRMIDFAQKWIGRAHDNIANVERTAAESSPRTELHIVGEQNDAIAAARSVADDADDVAEAVEAQFDTKVQAKNLRKAVGDLRLAADRLPHIVAICLAHQRMAQARGALRVTDTDAAQRDAIAAAEAEAMAANLVVAAAEVETEFGLTAAVEALRIDIRDLLMKALDLPFAKTRLQLAAAERRVVEVTDPALIGEELRLAINVLEKARQMTMPGQFKSEASPFAEALRDDCHAMRDLIHQKFPRAPVAGPGLPLELATPGHRMELIEKLRAPAAEPVPVAATDDLPDDPALLRQMLEERGAATAAPTTVSTLSARQLSAAANEAAPVRLVATLDEAAHPYLLASSYGGGIDANADTFLRIETTVTGLRESPGKTELQSALTLLTRDTERVCVDALMVPCVDAEKVGAAAGKALLAMLEGKAPASSIVGSVPAADHPTVLALMGRTGDGARLAIERFVAGELDGTRDNLERLRAAYLLTIHDIRCDLAESGPLDLEAMRTRFCQAIGLLGLLDSDPAMASWVRVRFAVYGSFSPGDDTGLAGTVRLHLRRRLEDALNLLERRDGTKDLVATLRAEMKTEAIAAARCAALGLSKPLVHFQGGYQAARLFGCLPDIGERLRFVQRRLIDMSYQDYVSWLIDQRIEKDQFHELLIAMSDARFALVDRDRAQALRRCLPSAGELRAGEPADVHDLVGDPDAYPMHSGLPKDEAVHLLSAHFAWALGHANVLLLEETLDDCQRSNISRDIRRILSTIDQMGVYLSALNYRITGEQVEFSGAVERACMRWARRLLEHNNERKDLEDADADRAWRDRYGAACDVAERLRAMKEFPILSEAAFTQAARQMHLTYGIYLANAFSDRKGAYEHTRQGYTMDDGRSVNQFLIAANMWGIEIWIPGGSVALNAEALRVLEDAEQVATTFVAAHPNDGSGVADTLRKVRDSIEGVRQNATDLPKHGTVISDG